MKLFTRSLALVLSLSACSLVASADTIVLNSSSSTTSYAGYFAPGSGTLVTTGAPTTYNLGTGGIWSDPVAGSNWVSFNPNSAPGGSYTAPAGTYIYLSTVFVDSTPGTTTGTLSVLADDSTSVYLNGTLITPAAAPVGAPHCTVGVPNCETVATYNLTGFVQGNNQLGFGVVQDFGTATGLDYSATIQTSPVPEPSSLMMLGTGVLSAAGMVRRRLKA